LANLFRLDFNLSKLSLQIAKDNADALGIDFDKYLNKVITNAMEESSFKECNEKSCRVTRTRFKKSVMKKKHEFINCIALKNSTTASSVLEILLVRGITK
jgi:hypothetical protein